MSAPLSAAECRSAAFVPPRTAVWGKDETFRVKRPQTAQDLAAALGRRSHDRTGHNNTRQRSGLVAEGCDLSDLPAFIGQTAGVPSRIWKPAVTAIVSPVKPLRP